MVWVAVASALVVLILLIAFILQNQEYVQVKFFGLTGSVPLGIALFIAAVGGGVLVAIAGAARIIQLRLAAHRQRTVRQAGAPGANLVPWAKQHPGGRQPSLPLPRSGPTSSVSSASAASRRAAGAGSSP